MKEKNSPTGFADAIKVLAQLKKAGLVKDYALAGAMAMAAWGYIRATADIDILIIAEITDIPAFEKRLFGKAFLVEGAGIVGLRFFHKRVPVDLFFAHTKTDHDAVKMAKPVTVSGVRIKGCAIGLSH